MKKIILIMVICLCLLFSACGQQANETKPNVESTSQESVAEETETEQEQSADYSAYIGEWVLEGNIEYQLTALEQVFGRNAIDISSIEDNVVKGTISSVSSAPSFRIAEVSFEGEIANDILTASYEDEGWEYKGTINIEFNEDNLFATITREPSETTPMWGIMEGEFSFVRPIPTDIIEITEDEKMNFEEMLSVYCLEFIEPFQEDTLTDDQIVRFIGLNVANSMMYDEDIFYSDEGEVVFSEAVMNTISEKYLGKTISQHQSVEIVTYENGQYTVPAIGGLIPFAQVKMMLKESDSDNSYYTFVDYCFDNFEGGQTTEYQYFIKLEKANGYIVKSITKIDSPIDFEALEGFLS